jgi:hypothetical protein
MFSDRKLYIQASQPIAAASTCVYQPLIPKGTDMSSDATPRIREALAEPFPLDDVKWKPQTVVGNRALAICYVDARAIMDRLDSVVGVDGWQDTYEMLPDGSVVCKLRVRLGEWIEKSDIGGQSDQQDEHDQHKAAFSDALKRAAVKFGIGRYLYRLPKQWADYDPKTRQFAHAPQLPADALPAARAAALAPPKSTGDPTSADRLTVSRTMAYVLKDHTERLGWPAGQLRQYLEEGFGVSYVRDLTVEQARLFHVQLEKLLDDRHRHPG